MYVEPHVAALCLELSVKSLACYEDAAFNAKFYGHKTSNVITAYKDDIAQFATIASNNDLMQLIKEYEKTINSRYGTVGGNIPSDEQQTIVNTTCVIFNAMRHRTGLMI